MKNITFDNGFAARRSILVRLLGSSIFSMLAISPVLATPPPVSASAETQPTPNQPGQPPASEPAPSAGFLTLLSRSSGLLGDMGGLRPFLSKYGLSLTIQETSEVLGNVTGGVSKGFEYDGLTQMVLQMDTQRAFGWYGGTFNISGLQIHGRDVSSDNLDTLQTASGIEADRSSRLWEVWYDQKFLKEDRLDVKIGQQSLDQEFIVSQNALLFVNTMFGWPMLPSADLPGGGPAYPLSAPGVRFRLRPTDSLTVLAGVFNGSPVYNNNVDDPQAENATGTSFPLNGGALAIGELQYTIPALGSMVYNDKPPLSGTYKLGFWYDTEDFADEQYDNTNLSLASPNSKGAPLNHHGDYAFYGVVDQVIWNDPSDEDADRTLNFFVRAMGTPDEDRNLIDVSTNAGFTFHEPFPHRGDDTAGIGMGYAKVGNGVIDLDKEMNSFNGTSFPVQSSEEFVEATYQYQLTPWWQVQPDIQYVFNPGGGIPNPNSSTGQRVKDELVLGIRTNILF
jgi:porin